MLSYLHGVVAARAVYEKLVVDIDGDMVNVQPTAAFAVAASAPVAAIVRATVGVVACKEYEVACL